MWTSVHEREHVAELAHAELMEDERLQLRRCATPVDGMGDRAQRLETAPHGRAFVANEVAPTAGAILLALFVASVRDRSRPGDEHDTAPRRVARVERGDRVVRHQKTRTGRRDARQDVATALAVDLAIAAGAGQHDRLRGAP